MKNDGFLTALNAAQAHLAKGFADLPAWESPKLEEDAAAILNHAAERLWDNYPYGHPLYAGQMLKPPHPIARAAYALAMEVNPNNHALDGGRASSTMEMEAVAELAAMFGWGQGKFLGHLSSGGTFANLEALWVAGLLAPGKRVVASDQAHYTHRRISSVLGLQFEAIQTDTRGRIEMAALEQAVATGNVGTVVATLGTTAIGAVDPLHRILDLQAKHGFRLHVDAAYGAYFTLAGNLDDEARAAFDAVNQADSVVVDPHKHGLQPYGCGCVLFRDATVARFYRHDSPFTYFTAKELGQFHLGEISLECSRAGASAVALWATQKLLPCTRRGAFARGLEMGREAALAMRTRLESDPRFVTPMAKPQLDILFWAVNAGSVAESSAAARAVFTEAAKRDLHLALADLPARYFPEGTWPAGDKQRTVACLRSVQMKPEHLAWGPEIWKRLDEATAIACSS